MPRFTCTDPREAHFEPEQIGPVKRRQVFDPLPVCIPHDPLDKEQRRPDRHLQRLGHIRRGKRRSHRLMRAGDAHTAAFEQTKKG